ncbi:hypothetical protein [Pedobacter sp. Leaf194]|uniref:hypothetical protein n=1 Tax=Pedobacter sp. Leaf194 TaxID=1736297 RepID=UPI000702BF58|nr:hypothetical protein [Pedobacter sp. Leaf194]KQS32463.1 hypothetical protein ASG14_16390 [Pedobacter sp. Leaf194]
MKSIQLCNDELALIIKGDMFIRPQKLLFRSEDNPEISYFRLILEPTEPVSHGIEDGTRERNIGNEDFNFVAELDSGVEGVNVERYLKGSFIFVHKRWNINALRGMYRNGLFLDGHSGVHDKIDYDKYHQMLINNC